MSGQECPKDTVVSRWGHGTTIFPACQQSICKKSETAAPDFCARLIDKSAVFIVFLSQEQRRSSGNVRVPEGAFALFLSVGKGVDTYASIGGRIPEPVRLRHLGGDLQGTGNG